MLVLRQLNIDVKNMAEKRDEKAYLELYDKHHKEYMRNWRAWGSWFSWGSPVGLGIFYACLLVSYENYS
jgi:hypothetical protein